jgi:hypothetical protein
MAGLSDYLEQGLLNLLFRATSFTALAATYVSLHTADPGDTGTSEVVDGAGANEWNGYARPLVETDGATQPYWTAPAVTGAGYECHNDSEVSFGTASITSGQVDVTHVGLWDALTSGNFLMGGSLAASKTIQNGDPVKFANAGDLQVTFS